MVVGDFFVRFFVFIFIFILLLLFFALCAPSISFAGFLVIILHGFVK